jgi:hypothetical protein
LQTYEKAALRRTNLSVEERIDRIAMLKKQLDADHPENVAVNPLLINAVMMVKKEDNVQKLAAILSDTDQHDLSRILDSPPDRILETLSRIAKEDEDNNNNNNYNDDDEYDDDDEYKM